MEPTSPPNLPEVPVELASPPVEAPVEPIEPAAEQKKVYVGTGVSWAILLGVVLIVFIAILAALNTAAVPLNLVFWKGDVPLISIILGVGAVTVVVDELIGMIIRLRRRRRLRQRDELKELKKGSK